MGTSAKLIVLESEREELGRLVRSRCEAHGVVQRGRMILHLACGSSITETAKRLGTWRKTVSHWRGRWLASDDNLTAVERLRDAPRSGAPARIAPQETCLIAALACKPPAAIGLPISHWSAADLARAALSQGWVSQISPRTAGRILKRC